VSARLDVATALSPYFLHHIRTRLPRLLSAAVTYQRLLRLLGSCIPNGFRTSNRAFLHVRMSSTAAHIATELFPGRRVLLGYFTHRFRTPVLRLPLRRDVDSSCSSMLAAMAGSRAGL